MILEADGREAYLISITKEIVEVLFVLAARVLVGRLTVRFEILLGILGFKIVAKILLALFLDTRREQIHDLAFRRVITRIGDGTLDLHRDVVPEGNLEVFRDGLYLDDVLEKIQRVYTFRVILHVLGIQHALAIEIELDVDLARFVVCREIEARSAFITWIL